MRSVAEGPVDQPVTFVNIVPNYHSFHLVWTVGSGTSFGIARRNAPDGTVEMTARSELQSQLLGDPNASQTADVKLHNIPLALVRRDDCFQ